MIRMIALLIAMATVPALASADEIIRYQLTDWKAKHIHDNKKADVIAGTLKKLGCELKKEQHNGHIDVKYRCPKWRQLELCLCSHDVLPLRLCCFSRQCNPPPQQTIAASF